MSTATEQMLTPSQLEAIPPLTFSNASDLTVGRYSLPHHEQRDVIAHDDNGAVSHDIWFQTQVCWSKTFSKALCELTARSSLWIQTLSSACIACSCSPSLEIKELSMTRSSATGRGLRSLFLQTMSQKQKMVSSSPGSAMKTESRPQNMVG